MSENAPDQLLGLQHRLQRVVDGMAPDHVGRPVQDVVAALAASIAAAGLPDQPPMWVRSVGEQLTAGELVVLNDHEAPAELDHQDPDPAQHAAG